jgi:hypothetical protein
MEIGVILPSGILQILIPGANGVNDSNELMVSPVKVKPGNPLGWQRMALNGQEFFDPVLMGRIMVLVGHGVVL